MDICQTWPRCRNVAAPQHLGMSSWQSHVVPAQPVFIFSKPPSTHSTLVVSMHLISFAGFLKNCVKYTYFPF